MDVTGKFIIVPKHNISQKGKKRKRRAYHEASDLQLMQDLATKYAAERGEDFLIVQIVQEISKPEKGST